MPRSIWIIGTATSVGKTTLACAVLRILNKRGVRAIGFKPVSVMRMREDIDFLKEHTHAGYVYSHSVAKFAGLSGMTDPAGIETTNPVAFLAFHDITCPFLMRSGSTLLGDRELLSLPEGASMLQREDVAWLMKYKKLSPTGVSPVQHDMLTAFRTLARPIHRAWEYLVDTGPDCIVSEGAGKYLPVWEGAPGPDVIIVVGTEYVDVMVQQDPAPFPLASDRCPKLAELLPAVQISTGTAARMLHVACPSDLRDMMSDRLARRLLDQVAATVDWLPAEGQ